MSQSNPIPRIAATAHLGAMSELGCLMNGQPTTLAAVVNSQRNAHELFLREALKLPEGSPERMALHAVSDVYLQCAARAARLQPDLLSHQARQDLAQNLKRP